ncbi:hypothetical protein Q5P01_010350 [Channa striata]|uniref:Receptor ligand binding region domain-containing protein n=1 Tax=Channa striata TaxID=64152 RepID=A0AA88N2W3_CHASR|nr:hypothetical protein Q5P01_010350 [Channa striata]
MVVLMAFRASLPGSNVMNLNFRDFQIAQAMIFAIEEINNSTYLLPGISLGYKLYDTCGSIPRSVQVALALANGNEPSEPSKTPCTRPAQVQAIMGETSSSPCMAIATVIGPFHIPLISPFATCACLSDKTKYPSFLRTIPSDYYQSRALAQLVKHFGWTWVGAIRTNDDYGNNGMATFTETAQQLGICLEYSVSFFRTDPPNKIQNIIEIIRHSTSKVIVAFLSVLDLDVILYKLSLHNLTGYQWVGSEAWIFDTQIAEMDQHHVLDGAIGLAIPKAHAEESVCRHRGDPENPQLSKDGDIILGGIFSFHYSWKDREENYTNKPLPLECNRDFQTAQAMIFAIEEINNSTDLLPEISLGYKMYDTCGSIARSVQVALALANGNEPSAPPNAPCTRPAQVQAILGDTSSSTCMAIATVIGPFHIPHISPFATCACLSDKTKYPSFLRTIPSDYYQSRALAQLVKHFGWTWIGAIRTNDDYGNNGMATFTETAQQLGICLEYSVSFFRTDPPNKIQNIIDIIRHSTSKVIVAFLSVLDLDVILYKLSLHNLTGYQWVGSEGWIFDSQTAEKDQHHVLDGAIGLSIPKAHAEESVCRHRGDPENPQLSKDGDITLGGIFSFHYSWKDREETYTDKPLPLECNRDFQTAQAMIFAIEEINNSTDLLPEISLGYKMYDTCGSIARSVKVALALANGNEPSAPPNAPCTRPAQVQAILGDTSSSTCMAIATVIGPFHIPHVVTKAGTHPSSEPYPVTTIGAEPWLNWSNTLVGLGLEL